MPSASQIHNKAVMFWVQIWMKLSNQIISTLLIELSRTEKIIWKFNYFESIIKILT